MRIWLVALVLGCSSPVPHPTPPANEPPSDHPVQGDGAACNSGKECASGICDGEGCGEVRGTCKSKERICTEDLVEYCGCDGKSFRSSGSCPGARFSKRGPCP
jgi:hypothetical protein